MMVVSGPHRVSCLVMRDDPKAEIKCQSACSPRTHKRFWFIQTVGRWQWNLESAKECVTTHLTNDLALKMDGAEVGDLYSIINTSSMY